jgi:hypothetical protein
VALLEFVARERVEETELAELLEPTVAAEMVEPPGLSEPAAPLAVRAASRRKAPLEAVRPAPRILVERLGLAAAGESVERPELRRINLLAALEARSLSRSLRPAHLAEVAAEPEQCLELAQRLERTEQEQSLERAQRLESVELALLPGRALELARWLATRTECTGVKRKGCVTR